MVASRPDAEALKTKKLKKEDYVRPYGQRMARQKRFGVYFIFKSLEQGPKFGIRMPKYRVLSVRLRTRPQARAPTEPGRPHADAASVSSAITLS